MLRRSWFNFSLRAKKFITLKVFRFFRYDRNEPIVPLCALNLGWILLKRIKKKLKNIDNFFRKVKKGVKKYFANMAKPGDAHAARFRPAVCGTKSVCETKAILLG